MRGFLIEQIYRAYKIINEYFITLFKKHIDKDKLIRRLEEEKKVEEKKIVKRKNLMLRKCYLCAIIT